MDAGDLHGNSFTQQSIDCCATAGAVARRQVPAPSHPPGMVEASAEGGASARTLADRCRARWRSLNATHPEDATDFYDGADLPFDQARRVFAEESAPVVIDLKRLEPSDTLRIEAAGMSAQHLLANFKATLAVWKEDPYAFQLDAVRAGGMSAVCPFTGRLLVTQQSFLANVNCLFYRFVSSQVFYLAVGGIGSGFQKVALYAPALDMLLLAGDAWSFDLADLIEFKARMVAELPLVVSYIDRPEVRKATGVCLGFYHFAHNFWNELPGVERLRTHGLLSRVSRFLVLREPVGRLETVYPEIDPQAVTRCCGTHMLFRQALSDDLFVVRLGARFLPRQVVRRVHAAALQAVSPGERQEAERARERCTPLLWCGIRVGDRSWTDQAEGLAELICALHRSHPALGVVFDGYSRPADRADTSDRDLRRLIAQEKRVVRQVIRRLRNLQVDVPVYDIIGRSIQSAFVWARAAHVYVSPYGSLQHKVGWFTGKRGVIHSNRNLLRDPADHIWADVEGAWPPTYVPVGAVQDIESGVEQPRYNEIADAGESGAGVLAINSRMKGQPEFNNYTVAPDALRSELESLLASPGWRAGLALRAKERLKRSAKILLWKVLDRARRLHRGRLGDGL